MCERTCFRFLYLRSLSIHSWPHGSVCLTGEFWVSQCERSQMMDRYAILTSSWQISGQCWPSATSFIRFFRHQSVIKWPGLIRMYDKQTYAERKRGRWMQKWPSACRRWMNMGDWILLRWWCGCGGWFHICAPGKRACRLRPSNMGMGNDHQTTKTSTRLTRTHSFCYLNI